MKKCCECGVTKELLEFSLDKNKADGHSYKCKPCAREYAKKWRDENPEKLKAALRSNYLKNKEARLASAKKWRDENKSKKLEYNRKRKALAKGNGSEHYTDEQVIGTYGDTCYLCGSKIDLLAPRWTGSVGWENGLHIDHVIPISKQGPDRLDNVRPTHGLCNLVKNNNVV